MIAFTSPAKTRGRTPEDVLLGDGIGPRRSRAFTPGRILVLLGLLVALVLMLPRHISIGGYHLHPAFAPYLTPYIFG